MKFLTTLRTTLVAGALIFAASPLVSAESSPRHFAQQPQISALVTIAIPPYKW